MLLIQMAATGLDARNDWWKTDSEMNMRVKYSFQTIFNCTITLEKASSSAHFTISSSIPVWRILVLSADILNSIYLVYLINWSLPVIVLPDGAESAASATPNIPDSISRIPVHFFRALFFKDYACFPANLEFLNTVSYTKQSFLQLRIKRKS